MREDILGSPAPEYRSAPFWAWNGKLEKEKLAQQIEVFHKMGFGGFFMHVRCGMQTPYLGDEFMEMVRFCIQEAEKRGMYAHLYDEDRYPSGHCGGRVTSEKRFMGRELRVVYTPIEEAVDEKTAIETGKTYLVGRYDIDFTKDKKIKTFRLLEEGEKAAHTETWIYSVCLPSSGWFNGSNHPDVLNPEVTACFIKETHEKYKEAVGEAFGKSIPSIFTDEPNVGHMGWFDCGCGDPYTMFWTPLLPELYGQKYGQDLRENLPAVFFNMEGEDLAYIRYNFLDLAASLFKTGFSDQVGEWCEKNNIAMTGHFHSENSLGGQICTSVDLMRQYEAFHIPGIDMLMERVELATAKQTMSIVHQYGRKQAMTELYGAARWGCDFRRYKMQTDWQTAMGFTLRVPHLAFYSMGGESKRDYPASIGIQSPWHADFSKLETHFARTAMAMAEGKPVVNIGVIHPTESYWMAFGADDEAARERGRISSVFDTVTETLCRNHLDFDFISEALLPNLWNGKKVGEMQYEVIVVPGCTTLRSSTLKMLEMYEKQGGKIIFLGDCPQYVDGQKSNAVCSLYREACRIPYEEKALLEALEPYRVVEIRICPNAYNNKGVEATEYVCGMRQDGEKGWLMIAEAAPKDAYDIAEKKLLHIRIRGEYPVCLYNTLEGKREAIAYHWENGDTYFEKEVYPLESLLIRIGETAEETPGKTECDTVLMSEEAAYELEEDNVLVLDVAEYALDGEPIEEAADIFEVCDHVCKKLGMDPNRGRYAQPYLGDETPEHSLYLRYHFSSKIEAVVALGIEFVDVTEVLCNGKTIEKKTDGFYIDPAIRKIPGIPIVKGENILEIRMPFSHRIQPQVLYLLGDFGVQVKGCRAEIIPKEPMLYIGDVSRQGLPFYGGTVTYSFTVETGECTAAVECSFYRAAALRVKVDGEDAGLIFAPPYRTGKLVLSKGKHTVTISALGTRENTLAPLHAVKNTGWYAYWQYRPAYNAHTEGYRPPELGILKRPRMIFYR